MTQSLLEGKSVNSKLVETEDFPQLLEWFNSPEFWGPYNSLTQITKAEFEKGQESPRKPKDFFIQKKDGTRVGFIRHWDVIPNRPELDGIEIGYALLPGERKKGYCQEAVDIILDFLFLSTTVYRIQALTDTMNVASQRVLERSGFQREGTLRGYFTRGNRTDCFLYSILRDEWKFPRVLTMTKD